MLRRWGIVSYLKTICKPIASSRIANGEKVDSGMYQLNIKIIQCFISVQRYNIFSQDELTIRVAKQATSGRVKNLYFGYY